MPYCLGVLVSAVVLKVKVFWEVETGDDEMS
jgi:hypothetical protein